MFRLHLMPWITYFSEVSGAPGHQSLVPLAYLSHPEICPTSNEHPRLLQMCTGSSAYWVQPVLSEHTLKTILGRLGYTATSKANLSPVQAISEGNTKQMVFETFLVRVMCEAGLGASGRQVPGPGRNWPGPTNGVGSERVLAQGPDHHSPWGPEPA